MKVGGSVRHINKLYSNPQNAYSTPQNAYSTPQNAYSTLKKTRFHSIKKQNSKYNSTRPIENNYEFPNSFYSALYPDNGSNLSSNHFYHTISENNEPHYEIVNNIPYNKVKPNPSVKRKKHYASVRKLTKKKNNYSSSVNQSKIKKHYASVRKLKENNKNSMTFYSVLPYGITSSNNSEGNNYQEHSLNKDKWLNFPSISPIKPSIPFPNLENYNYIQISNNF